MAYVNLSKMPDPRTEYTVNFGNLNGGLNLSELEYRLKNNESPAMKNLLWREGVLCCRDGQARLTNDISTAVAVSMYDQLFHGKIIYAVTSTATGDYAYSFRFFSYDPETETEEAFYFLLTADNSANIPRGSFFVYYGKLYFKASGAYYEIAYDSEHDSFDADVVEGYTPIIQINTDPDTGAGDLYQAENRISSKKTVWYNAKSGVTVYHLPVKPINGVTSVTVGGVAKTSGTDYTVNLLDGTVTFTTAPPVTDPATNNTVVITYSKVNPGAASSIAQCPYATTYGGSGDLCVVMGGCPAQPNAVFWNTVGYGAAMDPSYFPMDQYQLCGDSDDVITGFGKQQSFLVVFKEHSIGRLKQDTTTVDDRLVIDMPYTAINDKIGCDCPRTIQLIENNLVWCNTEQGVHILKDSSYAYENNIECVSKKVNGGPTKRGLLASVRGSTPCAGDDTKRYWLCCDGECWVWDYETTSYKDPSWYYQTNIYAQAFASHYDQLWHINAKGGLTAFVRSYLDYGEAIEKSYRFATQYFGGYDRYKNVNSVIIVMLPETNTTAQLKYMTDYEERWDLSPLVHLVWSLVPRDLTFRSLAGRGFGAAFRRKPMCRRVHHFTMQLYNNVPGQDLNIVSAQVFYNYQGRLR